MTVPAFACLLIYAAWITAYLWLCWAVRHQIAFAALCAAGLVLTYSVHMGALILYFDLSISYAHSSAEVDSIVAGDGAKLVFNGLFFAPAASVALAVTGFAIRICRRLTTGIDSYSEPIEFDVAIESSEQLVRSANPYSPPANS